MRPTSILVLAVVLACPPSIIAADPDPKDMTGWLGKWEEEIKKDIKPKDEINKMLVFPRFFPGMAWDLKKKKDNDGQPVKPATWYLYNGQKVQDNFLANHAFGFACATWGMTLKETFDRGEDFAKNVQRKVGDEPEDVVAGIYGWYEGNGKVPPKGLPSQEEMLEIKKKDKKRYGDMTKDPSLIPMVDKLVSGNDVIYIREPRSIHYERGTAAGWYAKVRAQFPNQKVNFISPDQKKIPAGITVHEFSSEPAK